MASGSTAASPDELDDAPVARVVIDSPLPHLDRPFDYAVPEAMRRSAVPGARVRVRFAGKDLDAFVLQRCATSDHDGRLVALRRVVSPEPVLTPEIARLARAVADRYAGTLSDVLRLAVPPRHATTEREPAAATGPTSPVQDGAGAVQDGAASGQADQTGSAWRDYSAGPAFLTRIGRGEAPRAVWAALPGPRHWAHGIADAVAPVIAAGRGAVVVLPDRRDVATVERAVLDLLGPGQHARLEADLGPAARYRAFLACLRGDVRLAIGTRSAAFAPVTDLGLAVIWDDGDDSHAEPRAPYPHSREVLALRVELAGAALLVGGWSVSVEAAAMLARGWARPIMADRRSRRERWARVSVAEPTNAEPAARLPTEAWHAVQKGLVDGPVLVQVARAGYVPAAACQRCRLPARCRHCHGPVRLEGPAGSSSRPNAPGVAVCGWCARPLADWSCPSCSGRALRASRVGVHRTAEELGRAFPGVPVVLSRPDRDLPRVGPEPAIVLATAGVEPPVDAGYAAAVLLDGDLLLARPDLRAGEEALRRWLAAAALVRPAGRAGTVVVCASAAAPAVQALVRNDPAGFAARELAERATLGLPPALTSVSLVGDPDAVRSLLATAQLPDGVSEFGPIPLEPPPVRSADAVLQEGFPLDPAPVRVVLRAPAEQASELAGALHAAAAVRSARKEGRVVRVTVDPRDLG